jgi:hypothetical protein
MTYYLKSLLSTKGFKVRSFSSKKFGLSMNGMDEKTKPLCNFFKLNAMGRKGLSPREKQNGSPNHIPSRRKKLNYHKEQFLLGKRGLS